jgi:hypothetical protein
MKTSELTRAALNWAVAKCEGYDVAVAEGTGLVVIKRHNVIDYFDPSVNWGWGGPIIEREGIDIVNAENLGHEQKWMAAIPIRFGQRSDYVFADTPLVAAMRCYVASKLGDEVEIPKELR